ncbi:putative phage protein [Aeromonas phage Aes508]|uniref:Putative phage protein n=1 Tax=Aeromonas phage Aes508 TaxID=1198013 RepID=J7KCV9_9CAUD|nr:hypothetical protein F484_gp022 [Aeromonas phage Aes508]AFQ97105.1 putative phage protein [Aeromonas phage Aes508]
MKKYVIQWKDPEGFSHFLDGNLYGANGGVIFHDSMENAVENMNTAKEAIAEYLKGKVVLKKRLFGPPSIIRYDKPSEYLANTHKRMCDTMHIVDINVMPKQMR